MLRLKLQYFGHLMQRVDSSEKTLMLGGIGGRRRRGWQRMRWLDGITDSMDEFEWTPGVGDGQGGLACYNSWGHKELDRTERLNWMNWTGVFPGLPLFLWEKSREMEREGIYWTSLWDCIKDWLLSQLIIVSFHSGSTYPSDWCHLPLSNFLRFCYLLSWICFLKYDWNSSLIYETLDYPSQDSHHCYLHNSWLI